MRIYSDKDTAGFIGLIGFLYSTTLKSVIPSVQKFASSDCLSIHLSVTTLVPLSILSIFRQIFFKLSIRVNIGKQWSGIVNG